MTWTPPPTTCVRRAWLTLGSLSVPLEDPAQGYFCPSLDLGYPDVRDVVDNRPDADGVDDRTAYFGARQITAEVTALAGAGARIDQVLTQFAPFMRPGARPVLHYVLDRPGAAERIMTMRAAGFSGPIVGADQRDIQMQWVAADPAAYDPNQRTVIAWAGSSFAPGRTYNLTPNRIYPAGGSGSTTASFTSPGDLTVWPLYRVYGPVTGPWIRVIATTATGVQLSLSHFDFLTSYIIDAGHWVDVDTLNKTVYADSDRTKNAINQVRWTFGTTWPYITPVPAQMFLSMGGSNTSGVTQVQAIFNDAYLT